MCGLGEHGSLEPQSQLTFQVVVEIGRFGLGTVPTPHPLDLGHGFEPGARCVLEPQGRLKRVLKRLDLARVTLERARVGSLGVQPGLE